MENGDTVRLVDELAHALEQELGGACRVTWERGAGDDLRIEVRAAFELTTSTTVEVKKYAIDHERNPGELVAQVVGDQLRGFATGVRHAGERAATAWLQSLADPAT